MTVERIPFNKPYMTGNELKNIAHSHAQGVLSGDGPFTAKCHLWLEEKTLCKQALLTHSCTAALEMAALLLNIVPGDEVIFPSYTFVSTVNAFVIRGAIPVFVDIRYDTLNLDETLIEAAITTKTKAIVPVHYAGVSCEMNVIGDIASRYSLAVVEDAAQGVMSTYEGRALGSIGDIGTYSFHETKNLISGEGGAILLNREDMTARAEIIREKGTDRSQFFRGQVDKYTWQDIGSSFLPGELTAAFLWGQLEQAESITASRLENWEYYYEAFESLEVAGKIRRPHVPVNCQHNGHMFYVLLREDIDRGEVINRLEAKNIGAVFHYVPLHSSPVGRKLGKISGHMKNTDELSQRILRLPLWVGISQSQMQQVVDELSCAIDQVQSN